MEIKKWGWVDISFKEPERTQVEKLIKKYIKRGYWLGDEDDIRDCSSGKYDKVIQLGSPVRYKEK